MATILQLKVAKRRLFEKVSLERWSGDRDQVVLHESTANLWFFCSFFLVLS